MAKLTDEALRKIRRELEEMAEAVRAPGGWVALAGDDYGELAGTRRAWTGDVGYTWDGAEFVEGFPVTVRGLVRGLEDGRVVHVGFSVVRQVGADCHLAADPLGPTWRPTVS